MPQRVNAVFSDNAFKTLRDLAKERDKSMSEILRDALALEQWFHEAQQEGSRILVERNGKVQEVIPR